MEFEFTGKVCVTDEDFKEIIKNKKRNHWTTRKAIFEWSAAQDDAVFFNIGRVMDDICAEVERRIAAAK